VHSLERLFHPRSVALLGVSTTAAKSSYRFAEGLIASGFAGDIYLVNPRGGELFGRPLRRSLDEVQGEVDLVLNLLPPAHTPAAMAAAARRGARFAVIFTAGFAEMSADAAGIEARMIADARAHGMRIVGPNCMGVFSLDVGLNLTSQLGLQRGPIGMISQSGNVGLTVWYDAAKLDIGFSKFIGFGNQGDIPVHEYLEFLGDDPETGVVLMYLEGLRSGLGPEFLAIARRVAARKPVVLLKGGRTENGRRAARSHTASLAGETRILSVALRQVGIIEVDRLEELTAVTETLYRCPPFQGHRIAVVGSGGGHSVLGTDAVEFAGFEAPAFVPEVLRAIQAKLPEWAPAGNPVDMTGAFVDDMGLFAELTRIALGDPQGLGGSLNYGVWGYPSPDLRDRLGRTYVDAAPLLGQLQTELGKPIVFYAPYAREGGAHFTRMREAGVPCYDSLDLAARCLRALRERSEALGRLARPLATGPAPHRAGDAHLAAARGRAHRNLTEPEALAFLAAHGLPVPAHRVARSAGEATAVAAALGYPVVLKLVSPDVLHKSEVGGVALDLRDAGSVTAAFHRVAEAARQRMPGAAVDGVLVAPYRGGGVELLVGLVRDAQFGPVLMAGVGGVFTEVLADTALRVVPVTRADVGEMLRELRGYPLLTGARGRTPIDLAALEALLLAVAGLALAHPEIAELDLNPVLALPGGLTIADARIILGTTECPA
jgi:acetyltransferase